MARSFRCIRKKHTNYLFSLTDLSFYRKSEAVYDATLTSVRESFPQYVRELEGVAHGAGVDFHKVNECIKLTTKSNLNSIFVFFLQCIVIFAAYGRHYTECGESSKCSQPTDWMLYIMRQPSGLCEF